MTQDWRISPNRAALMLCVSGSATVLINGRPYHAKRGTAFGISPLVSAWVQEDNDARWIRFSLSQHTVIEISRNATRAQGSLRLLTNPSLQLSEEETAFIEDIHHRIDLREQQLTTAVEDEKPLLEQQIRLLQQLAVSEMAIHVNSETQDTVSLKRDEQLMAQFFQLLLPNYKEHRDVRWYAEQLHLSPQYFSSLIRSGSGYTPSEWIVRIVILNAKLLLEAPNARVKDVADELGFPEQFTFRKYFKLYTGMSPKEYQTTLSASR